MNTKLLTEQMFSKNIEEKFSIKYDSMNVGVKRILILDKYDISNHSLNVGMSLYGCIEEFSSIFNSYLKTSKNITDNINSIHMSFYNYIKYIQLNIDKFDVVKISSTSDKESCEITGNIHLMNNFLKECTLMYLLLKINDINNKNSDIYINIILKIIKNTLIEVKKTNNFKIQKSLFNLFKYLIKGLSDAINYFEECWHDNEISNYLTYVFNDIIINIFKIGNGNYFYRKIIRDTFFNVIIENDEMMRFNFYKDKYFSDKNNIFNKIIYNKHHNKF